MGEWPNAAQGNPAGALKREVRARGGELALTMAELGARFGVRRLTQASRARIAADLLTAGLRVEPPVERAQRTETVRVVAPAARRPGAAAISERRRFRLGRPVWVGAAGLLGVVILVAALSGGGQKPNRASTGAPANLAHSTATPSPPDPARKHRERAQRLAARGDYVAAVAALSGDRRNRELARKLRRRGAGMALRKARRELAAGHLGGARSYAADADRLGSDDAAARIVRLADARAAARRAAARERRRLAAIARDQRTCRASEKDVVNSGGTTPPGCADYAATVAERDAAENADATAGCDSNYRGACLDPNVSDYDCAGGSGDGPGYVNGPVEVVGDDWADLDRDGDGVGCDT